MICNRTKLKILQSIYGIIESVKAKISRQTLYRAYRQILHRQLKFENEKRLATAVAAACFIIYHGFLAGIPETDSECDFQ